jgi:leucyl-tRNA synthetase/very-short-patch-repair endonuclease
MATILFVVRKNRMEYNFRAIEQKWQQKWKEDKAYEVPNESTKPKFYVLDMFPYPSGAGLHVGHPLGYIASDIYSRYKRLKGFNVLHPMGFDSFGLPAEQYALETGQHPATTTEKNIETFKAQLDKIGFCYDWSREVRTSDPSYYKWTQKIFLELFNSYFCNTCKKALPIIELIKKYETKGGSSFTAEQWNAFTKAEQEAILMKRRLAFSSFGEVNWCEALGTVLANDEVVNGVSERGGHLVIKKKMRQWYLRITAYADRLLQGLETVQFSEPMKEMQRNWIGRSEGCELEFAVGSVQLAVGNNQLAEGKEQLAIKVYTTRPDTIFGVDFLVLAPEHSLVAQITTDAEKVKVEEYLTYVKSRSDRERMSEVKQITGCFTGAYATNPFNGKQIPVWIAEYVLAGYGTGAIMAVPCGDQRDFAFAQHFKIPITNIIGEHYNGEEANATKEATLQNSDFLNGMLMKDAIGVAINKIEELGIGKRKVNYRMRDAGFSRQRYWGEPFPIVWQEETAIALSETDLPLELPHAEKYGPGPEGEGPLANMGEWVNLTPASPLERSQENLTPNPSPRERELGDLNEDESGVEQVRGYMNSTYEEWKKTFEFAKRNRKNLTEAEDKMWQLVRNRYIDNYKFRRQHPIAGFIPDFVCLEKKLIIEIDGGYHNEEEQIIFDGARENWLKEFDFDIIRFTNEEVLEDITVVKKSISEKLKALADKASLQSSQAPLLWRGGGEVPLRRETSTMPGYAGSSWYFLRYMDPHNTQTFCDRKASDYWNQVDVYVGGTEHAVGHLLYSRMWTKVLYDLGYIGFEEPFKKLVNQGMIQGSSRFVKKIIPSLIAKEGDINRFSQGQIAASIKPYIYISNSLAEQKNLDKTEILKELNIHCLNTFGIENIKIDDFTIKEDVYRISTSCVDGFELNIDKLKEWRDEYKSAYFIKDEKGKFTCDSEVEKMSKSKYNTVNPDELCNQYGADTFRMYEMFLGPVEQSKPWDTKGIEGVHRFLKKLWRLFYTDINPATNTGGEPKWVDEKPSDAEYKILHKTIKKIEQDTENFSYNTAVAAFMISVNELSDAKCYKKEILSQILILLTPYAPHIAEELWEALGCEGSILNASYPTLNESYLVEATKEYPVSINGKTRSSINLPTEATEEEAKAAVLSNEVILKWMEGAEVKKFIFVKGRMINVVV